MRSKPMAREVTETSSEPTETPPAPPRLGAIPVDDPGSVVAGNERMTALAGTVLLILILAELATVAGLRLLLAVHIFIGVVLAGPLAVKLASTGYRFVRYYRRSPAFVGKGPPRPALRVLAPVLVVTTLAVVGSGIGLLVTGPTRPGPFLFLHGISFVLWLPLVAIHAVAYLPKLPGLLGGDWRNEEADHVPRRRVPVGVNLAGLVLGGLAGLFALASAGPWNAWIKTNWDVPGPFVAGTVLAALTVVAARPQRWT